MPEGHSVHRIARQFELHFVGRVCEVSSPQGRFAAGAAQLDGRKMIAARAVAKQMFLEFEGDLFLRVHLGLYGAWDFAGEISTDATMRSAKGRIGQTNQRGTVTEDGDAGDDADHVPDDDGEDSLRSIGAPRRSRYRMAEQEKVEDPIEAFPPDPVGQVRVRILTETAVADLRGPTACVVEDPAGVQRALDKLGPDPMNDDGPEAEKAFVDNVRKRNVAIGQLLMDQSVVSGIGNVYRAELLFRQRIDPYKPGKEITVRQAKALWQDWSKLLHDGVRIGQMMTMDGLTDAEYRKAMRSRADRHWVYHRAGEPCRVCGTEIRVADMAGRKLYWCPEDQK
ncbi:Fpg/Nei family DNA glycosylase [Curtobacterium sp. MCJR17_055]|uniref:Fpg/Nei family DNA glycosylase n=1 Tax=unclassified Curtobacterium TaxID=257496 RepID=UPI000D9A1FA1|nr:MULTISPECIES: DNA-formamidopyrimidine glycosylase family protein [unclassified Curtobacterium]PYY34530.1 Fpg/Nei family DNA glycosylase [Curtobacterium sp. MCBD17_029]PYY57654.1 Fpg/Nei family DNA glycosylase [Curtobacterium sp. MCPF17_015]PYY58312.1 Fpg/Nei family DNA glycosylase [Curtobacterium sp. MCJR17_055]